MIARLALLLLLRAPIQCASDPDPNRRLEDTPSEALWRLAERFEADGDEAARRIALEEIVERYPSSAEAERARVALGSAEAATSDDAANAGGANAGATTGRGVASDGVTNGGEATSGAASDGVTSGGEATHASGAP